MNRKTQLRYKSLLERRFMKYCDDNSFVVKWGYENVILKYRSPVDGKIHKYYTDFYMEVRKKDSPLRRIIIEVKPHSQTIEPKKTKSKKHHRLIYESNTFAVNSAKWESAIAFCKENGWEFHIITEKQLK